MDFKDITRNEKFENVENILFKAVRNPGDINPAGKAEYEKARSFLSIVSPTYNISFYDHLLAILHKILRYGIENPVDKFENISLALKNEKQAEEESDLIELTPPNEVLTKFIHEKRIFYQLKMEPSKDSIRLADDDDVEPADGERAVPAAVVPAPPVEEEDDEDLPPPSEMPDLYYSLHRFAMCGVGGVGPDEGVELGVAMRLLANKYRLGDSAHFWGKVHALMGEYYVVESPFVEGVARESFGWVPEEPDPTPDEDEEENEEEEAEEKSEEHTENPNPDEAEGDEDEESDVPKQRPIPPEPVPKPPKVKYVPPEEDGAGVNENLYFVCTKLGEPWRCLPSLKPYQITDAKRIKRFFTGNLEAEVGGVVHFRGREAHYLRAQIARITASTFISPDGYFESPEDEDEEEGGKFAKSESYEVRAVMEVFEDQFEAWVHCRMAILDQGRCKLLTTDDLEDEEEEEEEEEEGKEKEEDGDDVILEALKEDEVPALRTISEDIAIGGLKPWTIKLSSKLGNIMSILLVQSNLWQGSFTYYDGKVFDTIYIGFGHKYSVFHYAPVILCIAQKEYEVDEELEEPEESEKEEEEEEEAEEENEEEDEEGEGEGNEDEEKEDEEDAD